MLNSSILNSAILDSAILHKTLTQTISIWLKLIDSDSTWCYQPSWILPSCIQLFCTKKKLHSFILTQLDDVSHLEFSHIGFWHCYLGFKHLVIFPQIPSKTLSLHSDSDWKLIQPDSNSLILTQLDDSSHLEFFHHGFIHFTPKTTSLIHSDSTWWLQLSWILPSCIHPFYTKKTSLVHSDLTWWWQPSWILPCWIQTPCYLLSDLLKNTLPPLWLWLKLIESD